MCNDADVGMSMPISPRNENREFDHPSPPEAVAKPVRGNSRSFWAVVAICLVVILAGIGSMKILFLARSGHPEDGPVPLEVKDVGVNTETDWNEQSEGQDHTHLRRAALHELGERARQIRQDVDSLQEEMVACGKQFDNLIMSDVSKQLVNDRRAVELLYRGKSALLPSEDICTHLRARLDVLMRPMEHAFSKADIAYVVSDETMKQFELIEAQLEKDRAKCAQARRLMTTLVEDAAEGLRNETNRHDETASPEG